MTITSFETALEKLTTLTSSYLTRGGLHQLTVFNTAYQIVTQAIWDAANDGYFKNPEFIEEFTVRFTQYYFDVLNDIEKESETIPVAWQYVAQAGRDETTPRFVLLLMGANAHINVDLALVMLERAGKMSIHDVLMDVRRVDKILLKSAPAIVASFDELDPRLNRLKGRLQWLYRWPVMTMVLYWRIRTWQEYRTMKRFGKASRNEARSVRIAKRLLWLGSRVS